MNKLNNFDLKKLKSQLKRSELIQSSLYKIAQTAHDADSLNDLYLGIHTIISKLMYANNFYIAMYNQEKKSIHFPYYVDEKE